MSAGNAAGSVSRRPPRGLHPTKIKRGGACALDPSPRNAQKRMTPMPMNDKTSPSSAAERARLYRERRSEGRHVARVEVGPEDIAALVDNCLLYPGDVGDRAAVNEALGTMLYALSEGAIAVDFDKYIELLAEPE